jgi:hypothetical protein
VNNIPDDPARTASPTPPSKINAKEIRFDLIQAYLDSDVDDGAFHEELENYIVENGLIHHWMRQLYTREADQVQLDMQDLLNSVALNYVERVL